MPQTIMSATQLLTNHMCLYERGTLKGRLELGCSTREMEVFPQHIRQLEQDGLIIIHTLEAKISVMTKSGLVNCDYQLTDKGASFIEMTQNIQDL